ncbi:ABC transporter permease [Segetibacter sp. 3557_3]|uniref:TSUP family transporter n=1 Tax=Segetibacter sp. 3557_3 TaxID=2547429 RepID=UPI001058504F|nr:TSUP family transporter [Segetibacter sp. 3557_3]TDH25653.1 ABC transporter permease [Segetibacter sp. 3557_3]
MNEINSATVAEQVNLSTSEPGNNLFPVFIKLEKLRLLIIGGGYVALEKLHAVLQNSPATQVTMVATLYSDDTRKAAEAHENVVMIERPYETDDLEGADIIIAAVNDIPTSERIRLEAHALGKLVNVADKPDLCDFYLSSVVKKGNLKIAISTNGKSPTIAKRLKETFNEVLPAELNEVLDNMETIRNKMRGDFTTKVNRLNKITKVLTTEDEQDKKGETRWRRIASYFVFAFFFMLLGHIVLSFVPFRDIWGGLVDVSQNLDKHFYLMILAGFLAQLVDGALGMGYGVTCTTVLLSIGINLPAISGSIHTAEMFSSAASGYSHYRFGNVNKKLFKVLLIPGIIGAVVGAWLLSKFGDEYAPFIRPILASYTLILGLKILFTAFRKKRKPTKVKHAGWLAGAGGFLDSFGGGGWGPLVTSTLISKGRTPRYVIGTVSITEFFVTLSSAITFFSLIGLSHWQVILGLIIGGVVGAPLAARLSGKLPLKTMFICVGAMVILWSLRILFKSMGIF